MMVYVKRFTLNEECLYTKIEYILKSNTKNIILKSCLSAKAINYM